MQSNIFQHIIIWMPHAKQIRCRLNCDFERENAGNAVPERGGFETQSVCGPAWNRGSLENRENQRNRGNLGNLVNRENLGNLGMDTSRPDVTCGAAMVRRKRIGTRSSVPGSAGRTAVPGADTRAARRDLGRQDASRAYDSKTAKLRFRRHAAKFSGVR